MAKRATRGRGARKTAKLLDPVLFESENAGSSHMDSNGAIEAEVDTGEASNVSVGNSPVQICSPGKQSMDHTPTGSGTPCINGATKASAMNMDNVNPVLANLAQDPPILTEEQVIIQSNRKESTVEASPSLKSQPDHPEDVQDWRKFFRSGKPLGALQYFEPSRVNGKIIVNPPQEAINEGIQKWSSSLVGQFFDKP